MNKLPWLLTFMLLFFTLKGFGGNHLSFPGDTAKKAAETDSTDDDDDNVRSYAIGLTYGSDQSYHGIHSNTKLPYLEPNFTYTAPSGFYIEASVQDILIKKGGGFDAFDFNPGWNIDLSDNTTLNFNLSHYIFRAKTPVTIKSDLSNSLETYIDQSVGETDFKLSVDYNYYKQKDTIKTPGDFILSPDITHDFKIKLNQKSSLTFIPEGSIDFGTRNAYTHYLVNTGADTVSVVNKKTGKRERVTRIPNNSSFGTLDYNLILTINYKIGNFEIEPAFNHTVPLYKPSGTPNTPLNSVTIALVYTIK